MIRSIKDVTKIGEFPKFKAVGVGTTFVNNNRLYIKVPPSQDFEDSGVYNVFCFDTGRMSWFGDDVEIRIKVDISVTFERKD